MKACTENELCKKLMECKKKHKESGGKGDGKGDHEEVCVEEMKACAADKTCSMLHEKMQAAMKKDGGHGGKDGEGKGEGKGDYGGKGGDNKYDHKKGGDDNKYEQKKEGDKKGDRRQLDGHDKKKSMEKKDYEKKEGEDGKKGEDYKKDEGKKDGDYKKDDGKDKKDMEPSAELKAAMKACTENELCKKLMECKKKHKESGGKGDGK